MNCIPHAQMDVMVPGTRNQNTPNTSGWSAEV